MYELGWRAGYPSISRLLLVSDATQGTSFKDKAYLMFKATLAMVIFADSLGVLALCFFSQLSHTVLALRLRVIAAF